MPIEQMASRGEKTMLFGPLKPVGLEDLKQVRNPLQSFNYGRTMLLVTYII